MGVPRMLRPAKPRRAAGRPEPRRRRASRAGGGDSPAGAGLIRLQRVLADRGVASRRAAEELMREGRVRVGGEVVREMGSKVAPDARIEVDGRAVAPPAPHRYVLLNKPRGIVSTARDERGRPTVVEMLGARERLYPVGRLDEDSEGLVLLTNDGAWAERVLHPRYGHEREYEVSVAGPVSPASVAALRRGITLEEGVARAARVSVAGGPRGLTVRMALNTGWKRQGRPPSPPLRVRVLRPRPVRPRPPAVRPPRAPGLGPRPHRPE